MKEKKTTNNLILMPQPTPEQLKAPAKRKPGPQIPEIHIHRGSDAPAGKPVQGVLLEPGDFVYSTLQAQIGRVRDEIKAAQDAIERKERAIETLEMELDNLERAAKETRKLADAQKGTTESAKPEPPGKADKK